MRTEAGLGEVSRTIQLLIQNLAPLPIAGQADVHLAEGLGLDSVGLVQLLFSCEERLGVRLPTESLLSAPLTFGRLVAEAERAVTGRNAVGGSSGGTRPSMTSDSR